MHAHTHTHQTKTMRTYITEPSYHISVDEFSSLMAVSGRDLSTAFWEILNHTTGIKPLKSTQPQKLSRLDKVLTQPLYVAHGALCTISGLVKIFVFFNVDRKASHR